MNIQLIELGEQIAAKAQSLNDQKALGATFHDALTKEILRQRGERPLMAETLAGDYWLGNLYPIPGSPLDDLVQKAEACLGLLEKRIRRRKEKDQETYTRVLRNLLTNLCCIAMEKPGGRIVISLDKSRKNPPSPMATFKKGVLGLAEANYLDLERGSFRQLASTIAPTEKLLHEMAEAGISLTNISKTPVSDLILKRSGQKIAFEENDRTREIRSQLAEINEALEKAPVWFNAPWARLLHPHLMKGIHDDRTRLHRIFFSAGDRENWDLGGRLYGGWWMNLPKVLRSFIQIDNESTAYLDWASMHVRLAYSMLNRIPPDGDLYDLSGYLTGYAPWKHRKAIKQIMSANFNRSGSVMRFPGDTRKSFARGTKYSEVLDAICLKHPLLSDMLRSHNKELGFKLTGLEFEILIRVILTMKEQGIVALPLHDGIFVKRSVRGEARSIMASVTKEYVGFPIKTSVLDTNVEYMIHNQWIQRRLSMIENFKLLNNDCSIYFPIADICQDLSEESRRDIYENITLSFLDISENIN